MGFHNTFNRIKTFTQTYRLAICLAGVGLFITWWVFNNTREHIHEKIQQEFRWQVQERQHAIEIGLAERVSVLYELQSLYVASNFVERDEFHAFTRYASDRFPTGMELAWVPWVIGEQRLAFEQATQKELPNFAITERTETGKTDRATVRKDHFPIHFLEPSADLLGFDMASKPVFSETLEQARDTGQAVASKIFVEPGFDNGENIFLLALPIYYNGLSTKTQEQRRQHLHGFYVAILSIRVLVEIALSDIKAAGIHFFLQESATDAKPFHVHLSRKHQNSKDLSASKPNLIALLTKLSYANTSETITVLNQKWLFYALLVEELSEYSSINIKHNN